MLQQRLYQIPASPHVQVWPVLLLDFSDFFRDIAAQKHERLPFGRSDGIRGHVLGRSLDLRPNVGMLRPECCEHFKCLPPEQDVSLRLHLLFHGRAFCGVAMRHGPAAILEAAAGVFLGTAGSLNDSIKGDKFKHIDFSHDRVPFAFYLILPVRPASPSVLPLRLTCLGWGETRAPRPAPDRRRRPCAPTPVPRPGSRRSESKNRLCVPWSPGTARR